MKICLISFDHWNYDKHIVDTLKEKNVDACHINTGKYRYRYPTPFHRVLNFISKVFLKKNVKKIMRNQYILDELSKIGIQDKILVINPDLIPVAVHKKIKEFTPDYIAYLYDSSKRHPIDHLLDNIFDHIYSFDTDDVKKYGFLPITNYMHLDKQDMKPRESYRYDVFMILSKDERLPVLDSLSYKLDEMGIKYKFIVVSSKKCTSLNPNIIVQDKRLEHREVHAQCNESFVMADILRQDQSGLSFRVFEAMAQQKKLITTNKAIKEYDFYDPRNILVIDPNNIVIDKAFFETPYIPLPEAVFNKYTLDNWVDSIFLK